MCIYIPNVQIKKFPAHMKISLFLYCKLHAQEKRYVKDGIQYHIFKLFDYIYEFQPVVVVQTMKSELGALPSA